MIKRILNYIKRYFDKEYQQLKKLSALPRYTNGDFEYNGVKFTFPDSGSFVFMYRELFKKEIYKLNSKKERPFIIDCGANIGMSVITSKKQYPNAEIIAFEPEKTICDYLKKNLSINNITDVTVIEKAVWKEQTTLSFISEGADANRITSINDENSTQKKIEIETVKLSEYINKEVDLLKLDIEGAEVEVMREIEHKLNHVTNIFVEYHSSTSSEQELQVILEILTRNNFHYYIDSPNASKSRPFLEKPKNDIFSFDFYLNVYGTKKD